ncbi:MAG: hypothetical protein LUI15_02700 [Firmicutes bacterium]|nr:hypothetical protein [Bacillota bacterium]
MFCSICGTRNNDGAAYCQSCGSPLPPPVNYAPPSAEHLQRPVFDAVKSIFASRSFLVISILISCSVILTVINIYIPADYATMYRNFYSYIFDEQSYGTILDVVSKIETVISVVGLFPLLFLAVGAWLIYSGTKSEGGERMASAGFSIIKTVIYFYLGLMTLISAVMETLIVISCVMAIRRTGLYFMYIIGFAAVAVIFTLAFIFFVKLNSTVSSIAHTAETGVPLNGVSVFAAVMCIFIGAAAFYATIFDVTNYHSLHAVIELLIGICDAVSLILLGRIILKYRSLMTDLKYFQGAHIMMYHPPMQQFSPPPFGYGYGAANPPYNAEPPKNPMQTPPAPAETQNETE